MPTRLSLYNEALRLCSERPLRTLSDDVEARHVLDTIWDGNVIRYALEQGQWNFATRTNELTYTPSIEPPFGYRRAFVKPADLVRLTGISTDEYFTYPLSRFKDEAGFWFCDWDTIYVSYVSDDAEYGADLSLWPATFSRYVAAHLAAEAAPALSNSASKTEDLRQLTRKRLVDARSKDAIQEAVGFPPTGTWVRARWGSRFGRRDRERG